MDRELSDEGREQEGHEHQSMTHRKPATLRIWFRDGLYYITESMAMGWVGFSEGKERFVIQRAF